MLIENGLKPVWVFDGKPPQFKTGEVNKYFLSNSFLNLIIKFESINIEK